jgi:23S rRNA (adenine2503-C2)-methyltransferase
MGGGQFCAAKNYWIVETKEIMTNKPILLNLSSEQLKDLLTDWGEPAYRARQIETWIYQRYADDVTQMTDLPKSLRQRLTDESMVSSLTPVTTLESADGYTHKTLFRLPDGGEIEAVRMSYDRRDTLCISTQAGCGMGCPFCATGQMGLQRNLSAGEIVAQVLYYAHQLSLQERQVSNVVLMGMGEPLANYTDTWRAIRRLNDPAGFNLGARRITLSTVGLVPAIRRMTQEPEQVNLAVSLHAPTDELRNKVVPLNRTYPLTTLMTAIRDYIDQTHRRVTFEYALMDGINDRPAQADQLVGLLRGLLCHVNLIPLNPTPDSPWRGSPDERVYAFRDKVEAAGITTTVRLRRGVDIAAGCGQLRAAQQRKKSV